MSDPRWAAVESAVKNYLMESFIVSSVKRDNEFETMWALAADEGGKYHVQAVFIELEEAAKSAE